MQTQTGHSQKITAASQTGIVLRGSGAKCRIGRLIFGSAYWTCEFTRVIKIKPRVRVKQRRRPVCKITCTLLLSCLCWRPFVFLLRHTAMMNGLLSVSPAEPAAHTHDVSPHAWVIPLSWGVCFCFSIYHHVSGAHYDDVSGPAFSILLSLTH